MQSLFFTRHGFDVAVLLTESAPYDLIVDTGNGLKRVQVKYSTNRRVDLRCIHSNAQGYVVKEHKLDAYDWLYVLHNDQPYLYTRLTSSKSVNLEEEYRLEKILDSEADFRAATALKADWSSKHSGLGRVPSAIRQFNGDYDVTQ